MSVMANYYSLGAASGAAKAFFIDGGGGVQMSQTILPMAA